MIPEQLGIWVGTPTQAACPVGFSSLSNSPVTIDGPNGIQTVTPEAWFTFGYKIEHTFTGLSAGKRYSFTVTQDGVSRTGKFRTAFAPGADFTVFAITCDNPGTSGVVSSMGGGSDGFLTYIENYDKSGPLPVQGVIHVDDIGYADGFTMDDTGFSGIVRTAGGSPEAYALCYAAKMGLFGNTADTGVAWGHKPARKYCLANLNWILNWGDHEFQNDIGWTVAGPAAGGNITNGLGAWDSFLKHLQPAFLDEAESRSYTVTFGDVQVVVLDQISNSGILASPTDGLGDPPMTNADIDNVLGSVSSDGAPFKLVAGYNGYEYPWWYESIGMKQPWMSNDVPGARRFWSQANTSMCALAKSKPFHFSYLHGDWHAANVNWMYRPSFTDAAHGAQAEAAVLSFTLATINGSIGYDATSSGIHDTSTGWEGNHNIEGAGFPDPLTGWATTVTGCKHMRHFSNGDSDKQAWGLRIDVYGSRSPKEIHYHLIGGSHVDGAEFPVDTVPAVSYRFPAGGGNNPVTDQIVDTVRSGSSGLIDNL